MSALPEYTHDPEKQVTIEEKGIPSPDDFEGQNDLKKNLKNRHMQMIAVGGAIGAGLFVGSGKALSNGGPASLLIGFIIVGLMLMFTVFAIAELAVLYPVNGAFIPHITRFVDPALGFACGWEYALTWLVVLPFEITAAGLTIDFWRDDINIGVWIAVFLFLLAVVQVFGVRGYGEVEFMLSIIKILACIGFIILGIIIDCGGVPGDNRGYIGAKYWHDPGAFRNGFKGFASVFVTASFAFGGTELTGLAAAESANPREQIPKASKQVFWRIALFYVLNLFIVGLIVPSDSKFLLGASGANTKASPFVVAIEQAGIKVLPSIFNAVITISVLSVANSCTYGSTRTIQSLASMGMAPKFMAYIDKKGRPIPTIILQMLFGLLAFVNLAAAGETVFTWLLSLSGLAYFFVWGAICIAHIRFRTAWRYHGRTLDEIPYLAPFGVYGSYIGAFLNFICLAAQFYTALFPLGGAPPDVEAFFEAYLSGPLLIGLYLAYKVYAAITNDPQHSRPFFKLWVATAEMDVTHGLRDHGEIPHREKKSFVEKLKAAPKTVFRGVI